MLIYFSSYNSCFSLYWLALSMIFFLFLLPEAYTHLKCFDRVFETVYTLDENAAYIDDPSIDMSLNLWPISDLHVL